MKMGPLTASTVKNSLESILAQMKELSSRLDSMKEKLDKAEAKMEELIALSNKKTKNG